MAGPEEKGAAKERGGSERLEEDELGKGEEARRAAAEQEQPTVRGWRGGAGERRTKGGARAAGRSRRRVDRRRGAWRRGRELEGKGMIGAGRWRKGNHGEGEKVREREEGEIGRAHV